MGAPGRTALLATSSLCLWLCARAHRDEEQLLDLEGLVANLERGGGELEEEEARTASTEGPEDHLTFDDIVRSWPNCTITATFVYNGTDDEVDEFRNLRTNTLPLIGSLLKPLLVDLLAEANIVIGEEFAPEGLFVLKETLLDVGVHFTEILMPGTNCSEFLDWLVAGLLKPPLRYAHCKSPIVYDRQSVSVTSSVVAEMAECQALFASHHEAGQREGPCAHASVVKDQQGHCALQCNETNPAAVYCGECSVITTAHLPLGTQTSDNVKVTHGKPDENRTAVEILDRNCNKVLLTHGQNPEEELENAVTLALCGSVEIVTYNFTLSRSACDSLMQEVVNVTECPKCCPGKVVAFEDWGKICVLHCHFEPCQTGGS